MAGPTTNADTENITANTARPITGAHQLPNRRRSRSNGTDATQTEDAEQYGATHRPR